MEKFTALAFSGITSGAVIALAAVGLLVLYKATGVINFAHGDLITTGAYLGVAVAPLRGRSVHVVVIATLGVAVALRTLLAIWQDPRPKRLASPLPKTTELFGAAIPHHRFLVGVVSVTVLTVIIWLFASTSFGRQVRALAANREMAQLVGIRVSLMSFIAFGLSAVLAGLAGLLIAPLGGVELTLAFAVMLNSFAAMIIGGFGSLRGVAVAAVMIGLLERLVGGYVLTEYSEGLPFVFMIIAIAVRPEGLFGRELHAVRFRAGRRIGGAAHRLRPPPVRVDHGRAGGAGAVLQLRPSSWPARSVRRD